MERTLEQQQVLDRGRGKEEEGSEGEERNGFRIGLDPASVPG